MHKEKMRELATAISAHKRGKYCKLVSLEHEHGPISHLLDEMWDDAVFEGRDADAKKLSQWYNYLVG